MAYNVKISKDVLKFIKARPQKFQLSLFTKFEKIAADPFNHSFDIKKLKDMPNHFRLRIGKYRILYEIIEDEILIYYYKAGSRGDIYKSE